MSTGYGYKTHWRSPWSQAWRFLAGFKLRLLLPATISTIAVVALMGPGMQSQTCQANAIVCENQLTGNAASEWDISGAGDSSLQGFATDISVDKGDTVHFKVDTTSSSFQIDIYRLGYYGGRGARKVAALGSFVGISQPNCLTNAATGLVDCGNWAENASWSVPATAVSGIYLARLSRSGGASHIVFVVRDDAAQADLLFQTSDTTWQAYNTYGGNSLYVGGPGTNPSRAYKVSYNRPITTRGTTPADFLFNAEYPMVRWLEANGYNVSYFTGVDTDRYGATELTRHIAFLSVGHDEYWSGPQRANVEAARAAGVDLAFFSGNEVFWKTRWEASIDGSGTPRRTLVCYKETHANAKIDPKDPPTWTGTWRDPRFSPPADGGKPQNALTGTFFTVNWGGTGSETWAIKVSGAYASQPFWRNTRVAQLTSSQTTTLAAGTLGYEWDENVSSNRPSGLTALSSTTFNVAQKLQDYGSTYGAGTATHALTLYRYTSGALVFGAGTVQWSWGLDGTHDRSSFGSTPDTAMRQATVNLFSDMGGIQPGSLQPGLVPGNPASDQLAPHSVIATPGTGASFPSGTPVTIAGTASDAGGGQVVSVQVSTDGGVTWNTATGTTTWSYQWTPAVTGPTTLRSRATDNSGNLETPTAGASVTITGATCPCTIWNASATPSRIETTDRNAVELGVRFRADVGGAIAGLRFYKGASNTGTHTGSVWTNSGTLLATATFTNETASGWQQVALNPPVTITANTTYVASYHTTVGQYAIDDAYFGAGRDNAPLHATANAVNSANGVYVYGATAFPTQTFNASNYWIDVVFATNTAPDNTPPTVTAETPTPGATNVSVAAAVTATFSEPINPATVTSATFTLQTASAALVPAAVSYSNGTATLTPSAPLAASSNYTVTVKGASGGVKDLAGNALAADLVWTFTTAAPTGCPCSIWSLTTTPGPMDSDTGAVELGVKFRADTAGFITGLRFYKYAQNTGAHVGHLWTDAGTLLGTVTFTNETASGWQQAAFATPVAIAANTTYIASYHTNSGFYASTAPGLTAGVDTAQLHALPDASAGGNGVYAYGATTAFPNQTYQATNYWVDVVFTPN